MIGPRHARGWRGIALWGAGIVAGALVLPGLALAAYAAMLPLPGELVRGAGAPESIRFVDAKGALLRELRAQDGTRSIWVDYDGLGDDTVHAILAAEDRRFFRHHGIDPWAVVRAIVSNIAHRRVVSGASTLTMQLARLLRPHTRTFAGKIYEAALALRIEAAVDKRTILEQYANRAPFGAGVRGLDAASRFWFDKPARDLSLAEAATLAAIPRGPAIYALDKHPQRVLRRRDRVVDRMVTARWVSPERAAMAKLEPLVARAGKGGAGAPHLVQALASGDLPLWPSEIKGTPKAAGAERVETTIDGSLQDEIELAARTRLAPLAAKHVTQAAVVVLDNASADVIAYVGSADFGDDASGGQNDGVRARRQPGSTLKPFVYGLAIERLGWTAATVLPDVELRLTMDDGVYAPMNYDGRFHGPVLLREALGSSLNVPAVWTAAQIGIEPVLDRLHTLGFASLTRDDAWYGPGIVLGDGEVSLLELASAYSCIAREGVCRAPRAVKRVTARTGATDVAPRPERRVMPRDVALVLTDVLSDPHARAAAFGESSALDFSFDVADKTGTSKGSRDNWTVGFTKEVTVAVWVGNFDGSPMHGTSGVTGAAPLFHDAMEAAMRGRSKEPLRLESREDHAGLVETEVCPLSGRRPTEACPHAIREWMSPDSARALPDCDMHERIALDRASGLRAGPACPRADVVERVFERYNGPFLAWAASAGRSTAPAGESARCPPATSPANAAHLRIGWPNQGTHFLIDPDRPLVEQQVRVRVEAGAGIDQVRVLVDGRAVAQVGAPFVASWALTPGDHVLTAQAVDESGASRETTIARSDPVTIRVE